MKRQNDDLGDWCVQTPVSVSGGGVPNKVAVSVNSAQSPVKYVSFNFVGPLNQSVDRSVNRSIICSVSSSACWGSDSCRNLIS